MARFALKLCAWGTERLELEQAFRFQFRGDSLVEGISHNGAKTTWISVRARLEAMTACELVMPPQDLRWLSGYVLGSVVERLSEIDVATHPSLEFRLAALPQRCLPVNLGETFIIGTDGSSSTSSLYSRFRV